MTLTAKDKATVKAFFDKVSPMAEQIGEEVLSRTLTVYPQTKTYFSHWKDLTAGSAQVRKHGLTVLQGVLSAVEVIDNLKEGLLKLSELHAFILRVDPANFKSFWVLLVSFVDYDFTPEVHVAVDKFLSQVNLALSEKYR
uniref:Globin domain-containing protein n=1 Tax=Pygocentrus nattereri TaxID=42514 RepID=A0AAR2ILT7_PYGNA